MEHDRRSPIVKQLSWGKIVVEGLASGRDFKLFPGGGRQWDWKETGTHHRPGIQVVDIVELLDHGSEVIVLSRGVQSMLHTCSEVFEFLHARGIGVYASETKSAIDAYNAFAASGLKVGGLFHSTC